MFSRVGIPKKKIITVQGTNFTSELLKEMYGLLGIQGVKNSSYHLQTDGLGETLKSMLRKFVNDAGSDWLPFAYREVPQTSTEFSPFQLLSGHPVVQ